MTWVSRTIATLCVPALAAVLAAGCGDSNFEKVDGTQVSKADPESAPAADPVVTTTSASNITWVIPEGWEVQGPSAMRVATFTTGSGDQQVECAVFYFGRGQGGNPKANIRRWVGQFTQPDGSSSSDKTTEGVLTVDGLPVWTIDLTGTYSGGMAPGATGELPDHRLLGAIIVAPNGPVFFKMTGPKDAVEAAQEQFNQLVNSVKEVRA